MTVRGRKTERNADIKRMLTECYPITQIARFCRISPTRVRQIKDSLLASGELMAVPHTKPVIYVDPRAYAVDKDLSEKDGGAERNGLTREPSYVRDSLPPNGRLPLGMVNAHITGRISMTVRKKGQMKDIKGPDGLYVGYSDEPTSGGKGKKHWKAHLRLFRQELSVNYYESSKGATEFYVNPGRVYYGPVDEGITLCYDILARDERVDKYYPISGFRNIRNYREMLNFRRDKCHLNVLIAFRNISRELDVKKLASTYLAKTPDKSDNNVPIGLWAGSHHHYETLQRIWMFENPWIIMNSEGKKHHELRHNHTGLLNTTAVSYPDGINFR